MQYTGAGTIPSIVEIQLNTEFAAFMSSAKLKFRQQITISKTKKNVLEIIWVLNLELSKYCQTQYQIGRRALTLSEYSRNILMQCSYGLKCEKKNTIQWTNQCYFIVIMVQKSITIRTRLYMNGHQTDKVNLFLLFLTQLDSNWSVQLQRLAR